MLTLKRYLCLSLSSDLLMFSFCSVPWNIKHLIICILYRWYLVCVSDADDDAPLLGQTAVIGSFRSRQGYRIGLTGRSLNLLVIAIHAIETGPWISFRGWKTFRYFHQSPYFALSSSFFSIGLGLQISAIWRGWNTGFGFSGRPLSQSAITVPGSGYFLVSS